MNESTDTRIAEIFTEAMLQPVKQRSAFIEAKCADDRILLGEVQTLIEADKGTLGGLDKGAILDVAKEVLEQADHPIAHPRQVGPFRIVRKIGEGSSSVVFEAQQERPRRRVALKLMHSCVETRDSVRRFEYEEQLLSLLEYSGIARIYSIGQTEGELGRRCYFSMEYVDGLTIIEHARREELSIRARLELFMQVCDAVQYAHQKGVIHRDLKPSNVLITSDGHPKILDFGVAKLLTGDFRAATFRTLTGQIIGTVPYMSPEQARGEPASQDTRTDVYALGVLLFELLTGELPHETRDRPLHEVVRDICDSEPKRLGQIDRRLGGDVEVIVEKAMAKTKEGRYQSPDHLNSDIRRLLDNEPVEARRPTVAYRLRKAIFRNKAVSTLAFVAVLAVMTGLTTTTIQGQRAAVQGRRAAAEAERSETMLGFLRTSLHGTDQWNFSTAPNATYVEWLEKTVPEIFSEFSGSPRLEADACMLYGKALMRVGSSKHAEPLIERAMDLYDNGTLSGLGGREDVLLAVGELRSRQGRFKEAEDVQRIVLNARLDRAGATTLDAASAMRQLAQALKSQGKRAEAIELVENANRTYVSILGPQSNAATTTLIELAEQLVAAHRLVEAKVYLDKGNAAIAQQEAPTPMLMERAMSLSARYALQESELDDANEMYNTVYELQLARKASNAELADTLAKRGGVIWLQGLASEALPCFAEAVELINSVLPEVSVTKGAITNSYGVCLRDAGQTDKAEKTLQRALDIWAELFGVDNEHYLDTQSNMGALYLQTRRYEEAAAAFEGELEWRLSRDDPNTIGLCMPWASLALARAGQGQFEIALECIEKARLIRHCDRNATHWNTTSYLRALIDIYAELGLWDELEQALIQDHELVVKLVGYENDAAKRVRKHLDEYRQLRKEAESQELFNGEETTRLLPNSDR